MFKRLMVTFVFVAFGCFQVVSGESLRFGIASIISPEENLTQYQTLNHYLSGKIGKQIEAIYQRGYARMNAHIKTGEVDFASICSGAFVYLKGKKNQILALPVYNGSATYQWFILVNRQSGITRMKELQGKSFVFTDRLSNTGTLYPKFLLHQLGHSPKTFFSDFYHTQNHEQSIYLVNQGIVTAASVNSIVFDHIKRNQASRVKNIVVIHRSEEFTAPPIIASKSLSAHDFQKLQQIFISMRNDPAGVKILQNLKIDQFDLPGSNAYQKIRHMVKTLDATNH